MPDRGDRPGIGPWNRKGGRPARGPRGNADRAHIEARRAKVETFELAGVPYRTIATRLEVSLATVRDDVKAIRAQRRVDAAGTDLQTERDLELQRLEHQRFQLSGAASNGVVSAHNALVRVADRKAKLLGLDAPQQVKVSGEVRATLATGLDPTELAELLVDGIGLDDVLDD